MFGYIILSFCYICMLLLDIYYYQTSNVIDIGSFFFVYLMLGIAIIGIMVLDHRISQMNEKYRKEYDTLLTNYTRLKNETT